MRASAWYSRFAKAAAHFCGRPRTFALAIALVVAWILTGPVFGFSDTWQLVINPGATIVTFLMVFLIQNTQNRDTEAIQVKLDAVWRLLQRHYRNVGAISGSRSRDRSHVSIG